MGKKLKHQTPTSKDALRGDGFNLRGLVGAMKTLYEYFYYSAYKFGTWTWMGECHEFAIFSITIFWMLAIMYSMYYFRIMEMFTNGYSVYLGVVVCVILFNYFFFYWHKKPDAIIKRFDKLSSVTNTIGAIIYFIIIVANYVIMCVVMFNFHPRQIHG